MGRFVRRVPGESRVRRYLDVHRRRRRSPAMPSPSAERSPTTASRPPISSTAGIATRKSRFRSIPNDVFEDALAAAVKHATPVLRASQADADELAIELVFERGLVHIQNMPAGQALRQQCRYPHRAVADRSEQLDDGAGANDHRSADDAALLGLALADQPTTARPTPTGSTTFASAGSAATGRGPQLRQLHLVRAAHDHHRQPGAGAGGGAAGDAHQGVRAAVRVDRRVQRRRPLDRPRLRRRERLLGLAAIVVAGGALSPRPATPVAADAGDRRPDRPRAARLLGRCHPAGGPHFNGVFDAKTLALRRTDPRSAGSAGRCRRCAI